jgi:outer membrane biosynthesis protein TonB
MRLQEFADAEEQIKLWKLISDSVWHSIKLQAIEQEQKRNDLEKTQKKSATRPKTVKKPKTVAAPKPSKQPKKQQVTDKSAIPTKQQKSSSQTQKSQVLPKVFTSTAQSNLVAPQTPVTSNSIKSPQSLAKTRSERLTHDPNSVANIQRQLYPLASSDVVKRLTS